MQIINKGKELGLYNPITKEERWIPGEIFDLIISYIPTSELIKHPLARTSNAFYEKIHGAKGLLSHSVECRKRFNQDLQDILDMIKRKPPFYQTFSLEEITKFFFQELKYKDTHMFMHVFSTSILAQVFKFTVENNNCIGGLPLLLYRQTSPLTAKMGCFAFLLKIWDTLLITTNKQIALSAFVLLFFRFSKATFRDFDAHFNCQKHKWLKDIQKDSAISKLQRFQAEAWNIILKTYSDDLDYTLQTPIAISAGLICLSSEGILSEQKTAALNLLLTMSSHTNTHNNIHQHIATTLILLNRYEEGGFKSIKEDEKNMYKKIFENLKKKKTATVQGKVAAIETFINGENTPKRKNTDNLNSNSNPSKKFKKENNDQKSENTVTLKKQRDEDPDYEDDKTQPRKKQKG